jgi:hypothetical protein
MPAFLITYDLRKVRNYDGLIGALRNWKAISPLESVWLADIAASASSIRDSLQALVDADDGILVVELKLGADWATRFVNENGAEWLRSKVTA